VYTPSQLADIQRFEYPFGEFEVVLKAVVRGLHHKSDVGGVRLGVRGADEVRRQSAEMIEIIERQTGHRVDAILVMKQVKQVSAELLISAHRDESIGPVVTIGSGGIFTEIHQDVVSFAAPIAVEEAQRMLSALNCSALFQGYRGRPAVDLRELAECIAAFSSGFVAATDLVEVEVNPLIVGAHGPLAVDAIVVRKDEQS
jgi:succinyl-CoA synthetase beta subunit